MTSTLDISSAIHDPINHATDGARLFAANVPTFSAIALTSNEILTKAKTPNVIDLLCVDDEGVESEVFKRSESFLKQKTTHL